MTKLLIADDEPLVCVGLQSLIKWQEFDIEIVGTARNGQRAAELVESLRPDIVITDVKMPLKSGLELAEECAAKYGELPLFIILTSFEEYELVRRAISVRALDYLVKLELTPEILSAAVRRALTVLQRIRSKTGAAASPRTGLQDLRERFVLQLLNNLFDSEGQYLAQKEDLGVEFSASAYVAVACRIDGPKDGGAGDEKTYSVCASTVQMVREVLGNSFTCHVTVVDLRHFGVILCLRDAPLQVQWDPIEDAIRNMAAIVHNYFGVMLSAAVGHAVDKPRRVDESYAEARSLLQKLSGAYSLAFVDKSRDGSGEKLFFNRLRPDMRKALDELDSALARDLLTQFIAQCKDRPHLLLQAIDAACGILHIFITSVPESEELLDKMFADVPEGYRSLYQMRSVTAITDWMERFRDGCCRFLSSQRLTYKQQIVASVQAYIMENLSKRLTLNEVAAVFNFSPNYLSQLFAKYTKDGFIDYITSARVEAAKGMFIRGEGLVYEVAEKLGFDSAFYFSKVFKKVEGISPREFIKKLERKRQEAPDGTPGGTPDVDAPPGDSGG